MTREQQIALVKSYFDGVDGQDLSRILSTLTEDCRFSVETHGVALNGSEEISGMFRQLWDLHSEVLHDSFTFVPDPAGNRIAAQFRVVNTLPDGNKVYKSNCNFFTVKDGRFDSVAVYMAGENTLTKGA